MNGKQDSKRLSTHNKRIEVRTVLEANRPFTPGDLGLYAPNYGSFSDWCSSKQTTSGKYNRNVCLKVAKWDSSNRPRKYLLLPENEWSIEE